MRQLYQLIRLMRDTRAVAAIEYGLLIALIALCILVALQQTATQSISMWEMIKTKIDAAM